MCKSLLDQRKHPAWRVVNTFLNLDDPVDLDEVGTWRRTISCPAQLRETPIGSCQYVQQQSMTHGSVENAEMVAVAVLRNIPSRCTKAEALAVISSLGFGDRFIHFSMPTRKDSRGRPVCKGFAFVCFADLATCENFAEAAIGYTFTAPGAGRHSTKSLDVRTSWEVRRNPAQAAIGYTFTAPGAGRHSTKSLDVRTSWEVRR